MDSIASRMKLVGLGDCGFLYVYRYHSRNVHPAAHHQRLGAFGRQTYEYLMARTPLLMESLNVYPFPSPVTIQTREGWNFFQFFK
jgi:hypothetical protein